MMRVWTFVTFVFMMGLQAAQEAAQAQSGSLPVCPTASKSLGSDPLLRTAFKAAYPSAVLPPETRKPKFDEPCLYPFQAILYESAVVLITLDRVPGETCHGCPARLSAVFLRRDRSGLTPVAHHDGFTESGTWGIVSAITPIRLGRDDGIVVQGGGGFQGESYSVIDPFIFRDGRAKLLGPQSGIPLEQSNCGAKVDGEPCRNVSGIWRAEPGGRLVISYQGNREDKSEVNGVVIYERRGDALVLTSGNRIAAEMDENRP